MSTIAEHAERLIGALDRLPEFDDTLTEIATAVASTFASGGKLLVAGNGGSAAEAQHLSTEFVGRLEPARERPGLPALALNTDTSALTALGNDYGYDRIFARQVEALGREGDVLLVLSTSGASRNLVAAVEVARPLGIVTVGLLGGTRRALHDDCDHVLAVPSDQVQIVQECHSVLVHVLVEQVEDRLADAAG